MWLTFTKNHQMHTDHVQSKVLQIQAMYDENCFEVAKDATRPRASACHRVHTLIYGKVRYVEGLDDSERFAHEQNIPGASCRGALSGDLFT